MPSHITRRQQAQRSNTIIDIALVSPSSANKQQVLHLTSTYAIEQLAERIRKRATLLGKRQREDTQDILMARDEIILALYAAKVPEGWGCAWCDGSSFKRDSQRCAGIGGILMDSNKTIIARFSHAIGGQKAFAAELTALEAVIRSAMDHKQQRLWVYTDNVGLARLWHEHRNDERLVRIRELVSALKQFALRDIPRLHNQPANALAQQAAKSA